ncbi:AAA family ATPase [Streptomyces sp. NPDC019443]|uniref:AAA family ATPase n=1 Tax=Streptomyces sp. NPDC019443 TaxID=3365061 RepID=UPI0037A4145E
MGRAEELAELGRLLDDSRLVTVAGAGGVGKSRFAAHGAAALQNRYRDGVWLTELSTLRDPELVAHTLVESLGVTDQTSRPPRDVLLDHLAGRQLLLVLDGFEYLVDECAGLVRDLPRRAPRLQVLAVSLIPLRLDGACPVRPVPAAGGRGTGCRALCGMCTGGARALPRRSGETRAGHPGPAESAAGTAALGPPRGPGNARARRLPHR